MIKRLGILAWWLGAIFGAAAILFAGTTQLHETECAAIRATRSDITAAFNAAYEKSMRKLREKAAATGKPVLLSDELEAIPVSGGKENSGKDELLDMLGVRSTMVADSRDTDEFKRREQQCGSGPDFSGAIVTAFLMAVMWCLSFVLSGSFWRPARAE